MNTIKKIFSKLFNASTKGHDKVYREWDRRRMNAMSPSELSEIDAIFARHM
jgi:hypothetical protein